MTKPWPEYLSEIEARANAATAGPWRTCCYKPNQVERADGCSEAHNISETDWNKDASFIAAARDDIPRLVARVKELEEALRKVSTKCWPDKDEANYSIYRWPKIVEIQETARAVLEKK